MRYIIMSATLVLGFLLSKVVGINEFSGISIITMILLAFVAEKLITVYVISNILLDKKIVTVEDINNFSKGN